VRRQGQVTPVETLRWRCAVTQCPETIERTAHESRGSAVRRPLFDEAWSHAGRTSVPRASVVLPAPRDHDDRPTLTVRCLGPLRVSRGTAIWGAPAARRARSVLEYLVLHRDRPVPKEVLMDHFWPEATPAAARNSLNVAIHGLRRFLREHDGCSGHVVFRNHSYLLDPDLRMWVDLDEFHARLAAARRCRRWGREDEELAELEAAEALGTGDLFEDDPYTNGSTARVAPGRTRSSRCWRPSATATSPCPTTPPASASVTGSSRSNRPTR